ncbi:hypothetical protein SCHPADRAFT_525865 [Schizopora paradoxa]|uniref:Uncharacterized protein n=1 Tax=Schizopora paradoxa TaxID=27342 RepID=A0A0H2RLG0_9AGAM|nr:hypothetical protein SCHPADRAFT_525865 [Schizopora paradoxa]
MATLLDFALKTTKSGVAHRDSVRAKIREHQSQCQHQEIICMDEMQLERSVVFISVDGDEEPFCALGHYPVLAFQSNKEPSTPFYIARVRIEHAVYYTYVMEGASFVTYQRKSSGYAFKTTEECTSNFEVLVLRYDPVDYRSAQTKGKLKDPTGPLGWKNVYTAPEEEIVL